jgi:hypothetical protein
LTFGPQLAIALTASDVRLPAEGLEGLDDRRLTPGLHWLGPFACQTGQAFGLFGDCLNGFLKDQLLRWRGTDYLTEPAQVDGAPVGLPCVADMVAPSGGLEPPLGGLEIPQGLCPCSTQVVDGLIIDGGDRDGDEVS